MAKHNFTGKVGTSIIGGAVATLKDTQLVAGDTYESLLLPEGAVISDAYIVVVQAPKDGTTEIAVNYGADNILPAIAVGTVEGAIIGKGTFVAPTLVTDGVKTVDVLPTVADVTSGEFQVVIEYTEPSVLGTQMLNYK